MSAPMCDQIGDHTSISGVCKAATMYAPPALPKTSATMTMMRQTIILLATIGTVIAEPIVPGAIEVIDGDTIRANGRTIRLVGFDAPESGFHARCESERTLAAKATFRLRQLVTGGGPWPALWA
jgi:endonuclease YncB( thermonuclease family)